MKSIDELRKEGRPLWMTDFGHEAVADLIGGGGDIQVDRLYPDFVRDYGEEAQDTNQERIQDDNK